MAFTASSGKGRAALSEFKQQCQDRAERKAKRKEDRIIQLLNTLPGALLTLLIERFDVIVKFPLALLQQTGWIALPKRLNLVMS